VVAEMLPLDGPAIFRGSTWNRVTCADGVVAVLQFGAVVIADRRGCVGDLDQIGGSLRHRNADAQSP